MDHVKLISKEQIQKVLTMDEAIAFVEETYRAHGEGKVLMPAKITLDTGESNDWPTAAPTTQCLPTSAVIWIFPV